MTKSKGAEAPTYRVIMPMVQILGHIPFAGRHQVHERTLYQGDVVPAWVPQEEVSRLLDGQFIEVTE